LKRLTIDWDVVERVLEAESNSSRSECFVSQLPLHFFLVDKDINHKGFTVVELVPSCEVLRSR
jgi:hypothetical protein